MAEYIEREELINNRPEGRNPKQIGKEEYNKGWNDCRSAFCELIEDMPAADAVPVARCKDCKYHHDCGTHFCDALGMDCPDDPEFFCSYGEQKEGAG